MQRCFDREHIDPSLPGIVLLSHGQLALGLRDAAQVVLGEVDNVAAFCLEPGDDLVLFQTEFVQAYHAFPSCLIIVDMKGGTPCNQVLLYGKKTGQPLNAVTGGSLPMLLEVLSMRDEADADSLRETALLAGNSSATDLYAFLNRNQTGGHAK